ncbi:MAG TPA: ABC transporter substrate-binding protein, partial [Stellaceae bacterium]|nr:ABC transporter substrate-binding protein [Stellaceae bacterium]
MRIIAPAYGFTLALTVLLAAAAFPARAVSLRGGTPAGANFTFLPLRIGVDRGVFKKYGLDLAVTDFGGGAKLQQAFAAGGLDVAVSAGTDMAFIAKGAPEKAVAVIGSRPMLGIIVAYDSPMKTVDDLKGKKVGVTTVGSMTEWLAHQLMRQKGWGPNDLTTVPIGSDISANVAALTTGQVDAVVSPPSLGYQLAESKRGRVLVPVISPGADFVAEALYASDALIHDHPDAVRNFVKAWFENMAWMKSHKAEVVEAARAYTHYDQAVE